MKRFDRFCRRIVEWSQHRCWPDPKPVRVHSIVTDIQVPEPPTIVCLGCGRSWPVNHPVGPAAYIKHPCSSHSRWN